jgi:hypothetical protein
MNRRSAGIAPLPLARLTAARSGLAIAGLAIAIAGCGTSAPAAVALPPKAAAVSTAPASVAATPQTPKQAVAAAYQGYWRAYAAAMSAGAAGRARAILSGYETPAGVSQVIRTLHRVWAAHDVAYGGAVTHVKSVQITGRKAILNDCLDLSHFGALDQKTGRIVPESFGLPSLDYYVTLVLSGGRWRVTNMQPVEVPCTP